MFRPVVTTFIDPKHNYVGFQGDFTFDSTKVTFAAAPVEPAGLTATNWNVSANILGTGTTRTLRISAFSHDFTPLNGCGTLFNLRMRRVTGTNGANTALTWAATPDNFIFIAADLSSHTPFAEPPGRLTVSTVAQPTPTPVPSCTPKAGTQLPVVLDHFKAYVTSGPPNGDLVLLRDQFDPVDPDPAPE